MPKVPDTKENAEICMKYCTDCLTYPGVEGELLFCSRGKSSVKTSKQGCNCGICEVKKMNLCTGLYFCIEGACE